MNLLETILEANRKFVKDYSKNYPYVSKSPQKQLAIFTCMDTRLVEFLEPALGIARGDAKIIKNAGNTIIDPTGGVIRSLVAAIFLLGVEEILVIGHKDCGMANVDPEILKTKMLDRGIKLEDIEAISDLKAWIGAINNPEENVIKVIAMIKESHLIPNDVPVHGLIFCPDTAELEVLYNGY